MLKKIIMSLAAITVISVICIGVFQGAGAVSDDPSGSYQVQRAPYEDSTLNLWFEHSTNKVLTSDTTPSGMNTYSVYMAKNEIENAQFVLCSDVDHTGMTASVSAFTDADGNSLSTEIYYEMYITTSNLATGSVLGVSDAADSIIREGETPDPIAPLSKFASFKLNGGKSQAFLIRVKTTAESVSGWYSAQLDIRNSAGQIVKTATVFTYVWDFALSDETALQTSFYMSNNTTYGGSYQKFYDYFLENRMNAMDIPGTLSSTNPYLTNDRVAAVRVSQNGNGAASIPSYMDNTSSYASYAEKYDELSQSAIWDSIKDKLYFYTSDEPMAQEQQDAISAIGGTSGHTVTDVINRSELLNTYWDNAQTVVPFHENHPYPYYYYNKPISSYSSAQLKDATQEMMDTGSVTIWCPQVYSFTPSYELSSYGYAGRDYDIIRNLSCTISGIYAVPAGSGYNYYSGYYNWDNLYGDFSDRISSFVKKENDNGGNYKVWAYSAGWNKSYTYCNHLVENTGLQSRLLFWQLYQNDVTGYLYYGTNNWSEYDANNGTYYDATVTGAKTNAKWKVNKHVYAATANAPTHTIYGNGVLFYGVNQGRISGLDYIGTIRVEEIRDGIEDYQMLTMLEELKGNSAADSIVAEVSKNVVNYVSLNNFDRSAWDASMDEYDILNAVHIQLGNAVEAASADAACEHTYDEGTVTTAATCTTVGVRTHTCTKCGAVYTEVIPALHTEGSCFTEVSRTNATCTADGSVVYRCTICGYEKTETITAFHNDHNHYVYVEKSDTVHNVNCDVCGQQIRTEAHVYETTYTNSCTEAGEQRNTCKFCGQSVKVADVPAKGHTAGTPVTTPATCTEEGSSVTKCTVCGEILSSETIPAKGHSFVDGVCTVCGEAEPVQHYAKGDINNDGLINGKDGNLLLQMCNGTMFGTALETEAADVYADGLLNGKDANRMIQYNNGSISTFD